MIANFKLPKSVNSFHAAIVALASHSFCCVLPLVLVAAGSTGLLAGLNLSKYHLFFSILGGVSLAVGFYLYWKESRKPCGCCACSKAKHKAQQRRSLAVLGAAVLLQGSVWAMMAMQNTATANDVAVLGEELGESGVIPDSRLVYFQLEKLHCMGCALEAEFAVSKLDGVEKAELNFQKSLLGVRFDGETQSRKAIEAKLLELGISFKLAQKAQVVSQTP